MEKLPLAALSAASCAATYIVQRSTGAVTETIEPAIRLQTIVLGYVRYLAMLVWPFHLTMRYPRDYATDVPKTVICLAALVAVTAITLISCRGRFRCVLVGWLWFLGMLVPVSGVVMIGEQSMADRYSYLTYTGLFVALVWGAVELIGQGAGSGGQSSESTLTPGPSPRGRGEMEPGPSPPGTM